MKRGGGAALLYSDYDRFAEVYSRHWGGFSVRVFPALDQLLLAGLPEGARLLDVCCGAGHLAALLAERGLRVTGVDGSREMIARARRNAPSAELRVGDARTMAFDAGSFDAATCLFDSLNHMMTSGELSAVFARVSGALRPAGRFVFDMNMEEGYLGRWQGAVHVVEDDCVCLVRARYDPEAGIGYNDITLFERQGRWRRADFTLRQKCHARGEVITALAAAGFTAVTTHDAERDLHMANAAGRTFFVCQKGA